ncbi:hypothetical protein PPERSA_07629 [Pseudocohnilembus persalinus]|uniref:Uncharacterized protein n=1 Tax=Pseudocohnilembus persalinus TaxID=266149 RepID=A0A0V0QIZ4_PSEPJ|nr:hypothetical protein PPERSA_07629 [Pseudocohnilembus persalinus]|eukprot:KRX01984.1 hypothetical protein PPERSA_07629 [Pseudocohnilembus persalinus]
MAAAATVYLTNKIEDIERNLKDSVYCYLYLIDQNKEQEYQQQQKQEQFQLQQQQQIEKIEKLEGEHLEPFEDKGTDYKQFKKISSQSQNELGQNQAQQNSHTNNEISEKQKNSFNLNDGQHSFEENQEIKEKDKYNSRKNSGHFIANRKDEQRQEQDREFQLICQQFKVCEYEVLKSCGFNLNLITGYDYLNYLANQVFEGQEQQQNEYSNLNKLDQNYQYQADEQYNQVQIPNQQENKQQQQDEKRENFEGLQGTPIYQTQNIHQVSFSEQNDLV